MVEVNKLYRRIYSLLLVALMCAGGLYAQPPAVEARIAGLESNADYMKLLREDAQLKFREDSTVNAVEHLRTLLREDPDNRQQYTQGILQLENRIFELRTAMGRVVDRINTIEQEWVLTNLNKPGAKTTVTGEENPVKIADSLKVRSLIDNLYFRENLASADYAALRRAQQLELQAVDYVNRYFANHHSITELAETYAHTDAESEATDIYGRYTTLQGLNRVLADSLAQTWNYIFDNKSYAYGYLMDKLNKDDVLAREEERVADAARKLSSLSGTTASDAVADYFLRKRVAVDYEASVAEVLGLDAARDSLRGVASQLAGINFQLPKVEVAERLFLDYDSVTFSVTSPYNSRNPIPECRVHARGTIYRVLLGTFNTKRAVDTFRGVHPLCYQVNDEGKWCYYAGGFKTIAEAQSAQKQLKARGFLRPEIIVWVDSLIQDPEAMQVTYRVEIRGAESLSDKVKRVIQQAAEDLEFSRVSADLFVVAAFTDKAAAEGLAEAVRQADASLQIKVAKTSE